jgi:hypothetical protein
MLATGSSCDMPSSERPKVNSLIEWTYEIYHINGIPKFSLDCLPDDDAFLRYISRQVDPFARPYFPTEHR